ncbi:MAG: PEP/pyruvate-binding domain-containing protein [Polyangiaceae bacterium]|nr:PEP/pyruvate-binding domain-containing protein [Polyangiaceae bacterium]
MAQFFQIAALLSCSALGLAGCGSVGTGETDLAISEVCSNNQGAWVDEHGETDDFIELVNASEGPLNLSNFELGQSGEALTRLPNQELAPGERVLIWADEATDQGPFHLPFRVSSKGETLVLRDRKRALESRVTVPLLAESEVWARFPDIIGTFEICRYASPLKTNGAKCSPPSRPDITDEVTYAPFKFPEPFPERSQFLELTELALRPASFVELLSTTTEALPKGRFSLRLAPHKPGQLWPTITDGVEIWDGQKSVASGERFTIPIPPEATSTLELDPEFEGVLTLFDRTTGDRAVWRQDFMQWPTGAVLARSEDSTSLRLCALSTPGKPNTECQALLSRPVGGRLRNFWTPGDYQALANGGSDVGIDSVKFVVELKAPGFVHFLGSATWDLHYTFIRESIEGAPHLNRCLDDQRALFNQGWYDFSVKNYFQVEGRDYLLGTLDAFASTDLKLVDYTFGDAISGPQMLSAYQQVLPRLREPTLWALHPQDSSQEARLREVDGQAPIVSKNAPFRGIRLQALNKAVGFGELVYVPEDQLANAALGPERIVITDDVPNDVGLVGGLITEAFQTPLAHVNVLSQARGTPNLALINARHDPRVAPWLGKLVRFEVGAGGFSITGASIEEAQEHWAKWRANRPAIVPVIDRVPRGVVPLEGLGVGAMPYVGAKAAQLAELSGMPAPDCGAPLLTPVSAFAIPVSHFFNHFTASGAEALLDELLASPAILGDPAARWAALAKVRQSILEYPVDASLLNELAAAIHARFGDARVRLRSSSNTEDLTGFSGAGLHTSTSAALGDPERPLDVGVRTVWASLYRDRAFDERQLAGIDERRAAMAILVHEGFLSEEANGVAVSRSVLNPTNSEERYINAQIGEASVTNPAPGVSTEELLISLNTYSSDPIRYVGRSSLTPGAVLSLSEAQKVACFIGAIDAHFRGILDPKREARRFAMEMEFKLVGPNHDLWIKQTRPYHFGNQPDTVDCREY